MALIGVGVNNFSTAIYLANRPPLLEFEQLDLLRPLRVGEVKSIADQTGNHWRKIFNVYAKFLFELREGAGFSSWQSYRDERLLQADSNEALFFSPPAELDTHQRCDVGVHVVAGRGYAKALNLPAGFIWLDNYFAVNNAARIIISPYLDYRQLSNNRISTLVKLVKELQ